MKNNKKCLDVDSIFSGLMQESWLMFMKGDLIKVHSLNVQVIFYCTYTPLLFTPSRFFKLLICNLRHEKKKAERKKLYVFPSACQVNLFSCTSPRKNLRRDAEPIYLENRWNSRVKLRELRLFIPFLILFVAFNSTQSKRVSAELVYQSNSGCRWFISLYFTAPECTPWFWSEP